MNLDLIKFNIARMCLPRNRVQLIAFVASLAINAMCAISMLVASVAFRASLMPGVPLGLLFVNVLACIVILCGDFRERRFAIRSMRRRFRNCWKCSYPLPSSDRCGTCPECGSPWTARDLRLCWASFIDIWSLERRSSRMLQLCRDPEHSSRPSRSSASQVR